MAIVERALCDMCGADKDVHPVLVVWGGKKGHPWEADLCGSCYRDAFGVLERKSRRAVRSNVRPQHRMKKLDEDSFSV